MLLEGAWFIGNRNKLFITNFYIKYNVTPDLRLEMMGPKDPLGRPFNY
jgi:hypothetical protein